MILNPANKSVTYHIKDLEAVELGLNEIEKTILDDDGVTSDAARSLVGDLNLIRDSLNLKRGVQRNDKFVPKMQMNYDGK